MCVALAALDAAVRVHGVRGERKIPFSEFHRLPGETPHIDTNLQKNELILSIDLPKSSYAKYSHYLKVRDRASYEFALVSVAAALEIEGGVIRSARVAIGGVAHKPWRSERAEAILRGKRAEVSAFEAAGKEAIVGAKAYKYNAFKVEMTETRRHPGAHHRRRPGMSLIGAPVSRVDGHLKLTGAAKYSAEFSVPHLAYAVMVQSTIASGRVASMDTRLAERASGVITVLAPSRAPKLAESDKRISLLQDDAVHYNNQPVREQ